MELSFEKLLQPIWRYSLWKTRFSLIGEAVAQFSSHTCRLELLKTYIYQSSRAQEIFRSWNLKFIYSTDSYEVSKFLLIYITMSKKYLSLLTFSLKVVVINSQGYWWAEIIGVQFYNLQAIHFYDGITDIIQTARKGWE